MKARFVSFFVFLASLLVTICCRVYQSINPGENLLSFFSSEFFCFFFSVVCYVAIGIITKISHKKGEESGEPCVCSFKFNKNLVAACFSCFLGVVVLLNGISILAKYVDGYRSASPIFEGIFAVLTGPVFLLAGVCYGTGKNFFENNELLLLAPVAWGASRSINIFLSYNMVSNVAWNLSDVLAVIFSSLFLLNYAKCIAKRDDAKKVGHTFWYGFSSVMFFLICTTKSFITYGKDFLQSAPGSDGVFGVIGSVWVV